VIIAVSWLARLVGLLADIPFALEWHIPTEKVSAEPKNRRQNVPPTSAVGLK